MTNTSKQAYLSLTEDSKKTTYSKIVKALRKMPQGGHFEAIAKKAGLPPERVWKRLPELVDKKILVNTKETRPTSTGRQAMVRTLSKKFAA
jgi:hypothetical protein